GFLISIIDLSGTFEIIADVRYSYVIFHIPTFCEVTSKTLKVYSLYFSIVVHYAKPLYLISIRIYPPQ
ncbi:MAG: hypothetical protein K8R19_03675, partial [Methanosarcinales archaeon]|nr:hypothetical protein [Methanosarcinales archaeon]